MRRALIVAAVIILIAAGVGGFMLYRAFRDVGESLQEAGEGLGKMGEGLRDAMEGLGEALEGKRGNPCVAKIPFKPTDLPRGWKRAPHCGSPERTGGVVSEQRGVHAIGFYEARRGFVYIVKGDWTFAQTRRKRIEVMGSRATLGDIHEGFSVKFKHQGKKWTLVAYTGPLPRKEFEQFVTGLRARRPA